MRTASPGASNTLEASAPGAYKERLWGCLGSLKPGAGPAAAPRSPPRGNLRPRLKRGSLWCFPFEVIQDCPVISRLPHSVLARSWGYFTNNQVSVFSVFQVGLRRQPRQVQGREGSPPMRPDPFLARCSPQTARPTTASRPACARAPSLKPSVVIQPVDQQVAAIQAIADQLQKMHKDARKFQVAATKDREADRQEMLRCNAMVRPPAPDPSHQELPQPTLRLPYPPPDFGSAPRRSPPYPTQGYGMPSHPQLTHNQGHLAPPQASQPTRP